MKKMRCLYVAYDIHEDGTRNKIALQLLYYGLHRVQYSIFNGLIPLKDKEQLLAWIRSLDFGTEDTIHIFDLCNTCIDNALVIGKNTVSKEHIIL